MPGAGRSGIALPSGQDAMEASTADLAAWLRAHRVPDAKVHEAERLDRDLRGFQREVLRYGLLKALVEKGYDVPRDEAAWRAFSAGMDARLGVG